MPQLSFWHLLKSAMEPFARSRAWLALLGLFVCVYSVAVVAYVESAPDLGLRSAFGPTLKAPPSPSAFMPDHEGGPIPQSGDAVVQLGNLKIETWPELLAAPRILRERTEDKSDEELAPIAAKRQL